MIKFLPIILAVLFGLLNYQLSSRKLKSQLSSNSTKLVEPIISSLVKKIAKAVDVPDLTVYVLEIEAINGLATTEGKVFITRGFLNKFFAGKISADELCSVIAHELGHVALGHTKRRIIDFTGQNALRVILSFALGRLIPALGVYIANFLVSLIASKLSRKDEYAADAYAAALLEKSGIGIDPQISLLEKLDSLVGGAGTTITWISSHPKTKDRIQALTDLKSKWTSVPQE